MEVEMRKLNSEELKTIVIAVLLMVIGILFCCSLSIGIDGLSVVIGLILLIIGVLFLVNCFIGNKGIFAIEGILGTIILSLGILFMVHKLAGLIFAYIPWLLVVFGCVVLIDAFLGKYTRNESIVSFVIKLVVGVVAIVLGLCLELIDGFVEYASIILGIVMILYSAYMIYNFFVKNKSAE